MTKDIGHFPAINTRQGVIRIALNAGKTQLIVFSVGPKPEFIELKLFGEPIIQTQTAKLLGILFDRRLSFKAYARPNDKGLQATEPVEVAQRDKLGRQTIYHLKSLQVLYTPCP